MSKSIKAVYQDGAFRPDVPLDLPEGTSVQLQFVQLIEPENPVPLSGLEILAIISKSWPKVRRGPTESTSENVDALLYGAKGDPGDVR